MMVWYGMVDAPSLTEQGIKPLS